MTLATICTNALNAISGYDIPTSFYGSSNPTAKTIVALANEEGCDLERIERWQALITEHTFSTADGTSNYPLPDDFRAFANMSQWDRTNMWRLTGPVPPMVWQWLNSGITVFTTSYSWFAVRGSRFYLFPTPDSVRTIAFDYFSKNWVNVAADGSTQTYWTNDNDTGRLDEKLMTAGVKWRFLQAEGMPFETEYKRWESLRDAAVADDSPHGVIRLHGPPYSLGGLGEPNIPETGVGS